MENLTYFKKFEVIGTTKDEAIKNSGLNLRGDLTQSYKKWSADNVVTEDSLKEWMQDKLKSKKWNMPKDGAYVVLQPAVVDTRERPYKVINHTYDAKTHTPESYYIIRDATNNEVGRAKTKSEAIQKGKDFVSDFKESLTISKEFVCKEKNSLITTIEYTPSKGTQKCKLLVFGYPTLD